MSIFSEPLSTWRLPLRFLYPANWCAEGFEEDLAWIQAHLTGDAKATDISDSIGQIALQGIVFLAR